MTYSFAALFDREPDGRWAAPGRVNLIGEHVDYADGLCLPFAIAERTVVEVAARTDGRVRLHSAADSDAWEGRLDDIGPGSPAGWAGYAAGVLWALREAGHAVGGIDLLVSDTVPLGAGLSSSAALECATALAVNDLGGLGLDRRQLAAACVSAENDVVGASTGGMDQAASLLATAGHALLLDARRLSDIGPLLDASHTSLAKDFEVSCRELDLACETARASGAFGARMVGGGFGGSAIALVPLSRLDNVTTAVRDAFAAEGLRAPEIRRADPSAGATRLPPAS